MRGAKTAGSPRGGQTRAASCQALGTGLARALPLSLLWGQRQEALPSRGDGRPCAGRGCRHPTRPRQEACRCSVL